MLLPGSLLVFGHRCGSGESFRESFRSGGGGVLRFRIDGNAVLLDVGGPGSPLVSGQDDFGLTQGLVWELRFFTLRSSVLAQRAPGLDAYFKVGDLMDFPGVANDYGSAERHDDHKVGTDLRIALTEVLKRGKTASIVVTRARDRDIDGFSLLMRLGRFNQQQLVAGITSWLEAYGHPVPPQGKPMPINLVMTFCAKLINQVIQSGTRQGLQPCFEQQKGLGWLADPKTINPVATNYPQFNECTLAGRFPAEQQQRWSPSWPTRRSEIALAIVRSRFARCSRTGGWIIFSPS